MAVLTIRNLEDETVHGLKERARANHRSLEAEVRAILESEIHGRRPPTAALRALVDRIAALTPGVAQTDSAELLRDLRDNRYK